MRRDGVQVSGGTSDVLLQGRAAALLIYLADEGTTSRKALSDLLWPDSHPATARANLRQLLRRLGPWRRCLSGADPLSLHRDLRTDAIDLLPERLDVDALPIFGAWLDEARERRRRRRVEWLGQEIARHEAAGHGRRALTAVEEMLTLDPTEDAVRSALALAGRIGRAKEGLALFRRYERMLAAEIGMTPDAATLALASDLSRSHDRTALALLAHEGARLHGPAAATALQRLDATKPAWTEAWERAVADRDASWLGRAADGLSEYFEVRGDARHAVASLTSATLALDASDVPEVRRTVGHLLTLLAWHELHLGLRTAGAHAEQALTFLASDVDPARRAQALYASGRARWAAGDLEGARQRWNQAHAQLEDARDGLRAAHVHANLGMAADGLGDVDRAREHYGSALRRFAREDAEPAATSCFNNLGQLLVDAGELDEAERLLDRGIAVARAHDQRSMLAYLLDSRSRAALARGLPDEARGYHAEAAAISRTGSDRVLATWILLTAAKIALSDDRDGLRASLVALAAARAIDLRPARNECLLLVSETLRKVGADAEADHILASLVNEVGHVGTSARHLLGDRVATPARDLDELVDSLARI